MRDKRRNLLTFSNLSTSLPWKKKTCLWSQIKSTKQLSRDDWKRWSGSITCTANNYEQGSGIFNLLAPTRYFYSQQCSHNILLLPLSPVCSQIKTSVTASGNSNQFNHSSFKGDRGMWKLVRERKRRRRKRGREHLRCHPVRGGIQRQKSFYVRVRMWWEGSDLKGPTQQSCLKGGAPELKWRIFIWAGSSVIRLWCLSMSESTRPKNQTSTIPPEQLKCKLQETKKYIFCMWNLIIYWQLGFDDKW